MRKTLLLSTAAICVLGAPAFAAAVPSITDDSVKVVNSEKGSNIRLAQVSTPSGPPGNPGGDKEKSKSPCNRNGFVVSPSHPNNGFGNCGLDGIPGGSGRNITNDTVR